jgi:hypothetical protein
MPKREPTSERHPSDVLVERLRQAVEAADGMPVEDMIAALFARAVKCVGAFRDKKDPTDIIRHALGAATMALALFQSLDDFKRHKTGTGLELLPEIGKDPPS